MEKIETSEELAKKINIFAFRRRKLLIFASVFLFIGFFMAMAIMPIYYLQGDYLTVYLVFGVIGIILFCIGAILGLFRAILGSINDKNKRELVKLMKEIEKDDLRNSNL